MARSEISRYCVLVLAASILAMINGCATPSDQRLQQFSLNLSGKTPDELIAMFSDPNAVPLVESSKEIEKQNNLIVQELRRRGRQAEPALKKHVNESLPVNRATFAAKIETVGDVCHRLLAEMQAHTNTTSPVGGLSELPADGCCVQSAIRNPQSAIS